MNHRFVFAMTVALLCPLSALAQSPAPRSPERSAMLTVHIGIALQDV